MSAISKQALVVDNNQSFPNNNAGAITPTALRSFNTNMIDSNVNQTEYTTNSGSWNISISNLNTFTSSQQPSFTALNSFTASQLTINTGYNSTTQSLSSSIASTNTALNQVIAFTGSVNEIVSAGILQGYSTRFYFSGLMTASIVANVGGNIAAISLLSDTTRVATSSFNAYTASIEGTNAFTASTNGRLTNIESTTASLNNSVTSLNAFTASQNTFNSSITASVGQLLALSSSLSGGYATQGELDASSSTLQNNIDTKLNTSSFNSYTASINPFTASINSYTASQLLLNATFATTGSNVFSGSQTFTGSIYNSIISASIVSATASLDFSKSNFFTLTIPASITTRIEVANAGKGQTALLEVTTSGTSATASFASNIYQPSASFYIPSNTASVDILTFSTFSNTNKIYLASIKTMSNNY